jgi:uncharacterized protein YjbI with pentapeptide repeats
MTGLELAAKALVGVAARPALDRIRRQEKVIALLKKFNLAQKTPPRDFEGIYTYTLIEYCYGKPESIISFFRLEHIREAFRESFETGDPRHLDREAEEVINWNDETGKLGHIDYDYRREFAGFTAVFHALVDRSRGAAEARAERKIDDLQEQLANLSDHLASLHSIEAVRDVAVTPASGQHDPLGWLALETKAWFDAVGYGFEQFSEPSTGSFTWIIKVPARRRFDRVVVYGVAGEASTANITHAQSLIAKHSADEAWVVVPRRVSIAARQAATTTVACYTLDELIDQDANFDGYVDWLIAEVEYRRINTNYVPIYCKKDEYDRSSGKTSGQSTYGQSSGGLEGYVQGWLTDPSKEHLSVLGEFGTGKSWFCLHFAWKLAMQYRTAKERGLPRPRLPLLIPLRDYAKAVSVESLFSEFFFRKHEVQLAGYSVFDYLNRSGRLLLIFDGFDEMASRVDRQARINNFWELAKVVVPGAKVLLTCRTEHFPEARESRDLLNAQLKASTQALTGSPPQFEVVDLIPFDDEQIRELLGHIARPPVVEAVMNHSELLDLMRRPVMSELVLDALPEISQGQPVDLARAYLYAVRRKISRDIQAERTFTSMSDKLFFLCEVSWEMLSTDTMSMNYRQFPDRIRACFGAVVEQEKDLDHWHHDMLGQSMLIRNSAGDYSPAHRSLLEFFVAYKFTAELGLLNADFLSVVQDGQDKKATAKWSEYFHRKEPTSSRPTISTFTPEASEMLAETFGRDPLTPVIAKLMLQMLDEQAQIAGLLKIIDSTKNKSSVDVGFVGGNAAILLARLDSNSLRGVDFSCASLKGARLDLGRENQVNLTGTNLHRADLSGTDLENTVLVDADMEDANLENSNYLGRQANYPASVATFPNAIVVCTSKGTLLRWPEADLSCKPQVIAELGDNRIQILESLTGSKRLAILCNDTVVIDLDSDAVELRVPETKGYIPVLAEDYFGVLTFDSSEVGYEPILHNIIGTRELDPENLRSSWDIDFYNMELEQTSYVDEVGRIFAIDASDQTIRCTQIGTAGYVDSKAERWIPDAVRYSGQRLWALDWSKDRAIDIAMLDLSGKLLSKTTVDTNYDDRLFTFSSTRFDVAFDAISRTVAISDGHGIRGLRVDTWQTLWEDAYALGIECMQSTVEGSAFVSISRYGDIAIRATATGAIISRTSFGDDNRGLRITRNCGLPEAILNNLQRAGGIVVD